MSTISKPSDAIPPSRQRPSSPARSQFYMTPPFRGLSKIYLDIFHGVEYNFLMPNFEWETPQDFFDTLNEEFNFVWDVAASKGNKIFP
jgi:hypothetical protein